MSSAPRVLSIQSHVVHGCVGNRAASLPLQLLGIETDVLNTVQYSNHVGYGSFAGEKLSGEQVWELLQGMHTNGLLTPTRLLTGYMGSVEAVRAAVRALPLLRQNQPSFRFWCDPVLGDNGRLYVPPLLVDAYRDEVVPHADALLPNQFEAELLSGISIRTQSDARKACEALHRKGVGLVIITSAQLTPEPTPISDGADTSATSDASTADATSTTATAPTAPPTTPSATSSAAADTAAPLTVLLSRRPHGTLWRRVYRLDVPTLEAHFAGTGDLLAALLLGWELRGTPAPSALSKALAGVQAVLKRTMADVGSAPRATGANEGYGAGTRPLGLQLLSSIDDIRAPDEASVGAPTRLDEPLRAVLFDMDGTLTLPHQLDFERMRDAAGLTAGEPIFAGIAALPAAQRAAAWAAVEAIELEAYEHVALQPGLAELIDALRTRGVRVGIATRNNARAVAKLEATAGLAAGTFEPVLTRDGPHPDKPHPAIATAAAAAWGLPPAACLMVGDSLDDMRCGRAAGMATCLIRPAGEAPRETASPPPALADEVDFAVEALAELTAMLDDAVQAA